MKELGFHIIFSSLISFRVLPTQVKCNFECFIQFSRGPAAGLLGLCHQPWSATNTVHTGEKLWM